MKQRILLLLFLLASVVSMHTATTADTENACPFRKFHDVEEVKREAQFRFKGGMLVISGGDPGSTVYIYDIKGVKAGQYVLDGEGCATLPLQHLGQQLYIVKTTRFTFKFRKS